MCIAEVIWEQSTHIVECDIYRTWRPRQSAWLMKSTRRPCASSLMRICRARNPMRRRILMCVLYTCHCSEQSRTCCLLEGASAFLCQPCSVGRTNRRLYVSSGLTLCEVGAGQSKKKGLCTDCFRGKAAWPHQAHISGRTQVLISRREQALDTPCVEVVTSIVVWVMMPPSYARQSVMYWLLCHVSSFALYVPRSVASFSTVATLSITQRFRPSCCTQSRPAIAQCRVRGSESAKEGEQYQQLYTSTPSVSSWPSQQHM